MKFYCDVELIGSFLIEAEDQEHADDALAQISEHLDETVNDDKPMVVTVGDVTVTVTEAAVICDAYSNVNDEEDGD